MMQHQLKILDDLSLVKDEGSLKDKILFEKLSAAVNFLIQNDFHRLVSWLYRTDVSEQKLSAILSEHKDTDAGNIIARLLIERQAEKIQSRKKYSNRNNALDDGEERW